MAVAASTVSKISQFEPEKIATALHLQSLEAQNAELRHLADTAGAH